MYTVIAIIHVPKYMRKLKLSLLKAMSPCLFDSTLYISNIAVHPLLVLPLDWNVVLC